MPTGKGNRLLAMAILGGVMACSRGKEAANSPAGSGGLSGEVLFLQNCATCHPDGGNIFYPLKSLQRLTLSANGITTSAEIVARMRDPGPRMKRFDRSELSDADARKIADYVLSTFR